MNTLLNVKHTFHEAIETLRNDAKGLNVQGFIGQTNRKILTLSDDDKQEIHVDYVDTYCASLTAFDVLEEIYYPIAKINDENE